MGLYATQQNIAESYGFRDAFGRLRISEAYTLFDSKLLSSDIPALYWDEQQTSGGGTSSTYAQVDARVRLNVSANTAGTRVRQTFRRFNYQPAKSQNGFLTCNFNGAAAGVTKRVGLFDANNGLFFQLTSTGMAFVIRKGGSDNVVPSSQWNLDRMDGAGYSGLTLDTTKVQILYFDFEWLGVGTVRFGFVINGAIIICHAFDHANLTDSVYMSTPNLPLRYEISNDGTGAAATLDCICSSVVSEGGTQDNGVERSADTGLTTLTTGNDTNLYPVLGIRLKSTHLSAEVKLKSFSIVCTSTAIFRYAVVFNPTLAGAAVSWTAITNSPVEVSRPTNASTVSDENLIIVSNYSQQTAQFAPTESGEIKGFLSLGSSIAGVSDTLWLIAQRITGTTESFYGAVRWREIM